MKKANRKAAQEVAQEVAVEMVLDIAQDAPRPVEVRMLPESVEAFHATRRYNDTSKAGDGELVNVPGFGDIRLAKRGEYKGLRQWFMATPNGMSLVGCTLQVGKAWELTLPNGDKHATAFKSRKACLVEAVQIFYR